MNFSVKKFGTAYPRHGLVYRYGKIAKGIASMPPLPSHQAPRFQPPVAKYPGLGSV
jgi:hypothetical protein